MTPLDVLVSRLQDPAVGDKERASLARTLLPYVGHEGQRYGRMLIPGERCVLLQREFLAACETELARRSSAAGAPELPAAISTEAVASAVRRVVEPQIEKLGHTLGRLGRQLDMQTRRLGEQQDTLATVQKRQLEIAREVGAVEKPAAPKVSRRRPLA